ncbi:MAG: sigma-70 family RNA polymerase sigma factor [Planctomycetes bacterium]|nr:sigma-70 family RNA polymerase sigma factor [Planctomycetota bacterium]
MRFDLDPETLLRLDAQLDLLARRLVSVPADADDARQEAWLSAVRGDADRSASLGGWLTRAIPFRVSRQRRTDRRRTRALEVRSQNQAPAPSTADIVARHEARLEVIRAVTRLQEPYRRTITLTFFEGLAPREVARVMDVPVETVRTRTRRALEGLRRSLGGDPVDGSRSALVVLALSLGFLNPGAAPAVSSSTVTGAILMSGKSKLLVALATLIVVGLGWFFWPEDEGPDRLGSQNQRASQDSSSVPRRMRTDDTELPPPSGPDASFDSEPVTTDLPVEEAPPEEPTGILELLVIQATDGSPVPDLPVQFLPFRVTDPFFREECHRTDANGRVRIDPCPAGRALVSTPIGALQRVTVNADELNRVTLEIPAGTRVGGVVVDEKDQPVAGAEIVAGDYGDSMRGGPITRSGADGRFEIPNFAPDGMAVVGARVPGRLPTPMVMVFPSKGGSSELRLILGGPAGKLDLLVVDGDGKPVSGARCQVGASDYVQFRQSDGTTGTRWTVFDQLTNDDGRVFFDALTPGDQPIVVRAAGFAPCADTKPVGPGTVVTHRVVLGPGGVVRGVVEGPDGLPLPLAAVTLGRYGAITGHYMRTNERGEYRFEDVAAGRLPIRVESKDLNDAKADVVVQVGEETTWNIRLVAGLSINGIVVDEQGAPVPGLKVQANRMIFDSKTNLAEYSTGHGQCGLDGRFVIENLKPDLSYDLKVVGLDGDTPIVVKEGVVAGPEPVRLVVPRGLLGVASLRGRLVGPDHRPASGATLQVHGVSVASPVGGHQTVDGEGRFHYETIIPGRYSLWMSAPAFGHCYSQEFDIADGEDLDLGDLVFEPAGHLQVLLTNAERLKPETSITAHQLDGGSNLGIELRGADTRSQPISPGSYRMTLRGPNLATRSELVEIRSHETTIIRFDLTPARELIFRFDQMPEDCDHLSYRLYDRDRTLIHEGSTQRYRNRAPSIALWVAPTFHRFELSDELGRSAALVLDESSPLERQVVLR